MKIAQLAPIWERIPPTVYGGIETVVSNLTEELVKRGHEVTLFATGNSLTNAKLVSIVPEGLYRLNIPWTDRTYTMVHAVNAMEMAEEFDIIHNHMKDRGLIFSNLIKTPMLTTLHGDLPKLVKDKFLDANYVAVSKSQLGLLELPTCPVVFNGIDLNKFKFSDHSENDLLFAGSIFPSKGTKEAIQVAKKINQKLIIIGKVDKLDPRSYEYYDKEIKSEIDNEKFCYLGEVDHENISDYMAKAKVFLMPVNFPEAFGMVMVEAMACGTPVVAFDLGSTREIVKDGLTGFVVPLNNIEAMAKAVEKIYAMSEAQYKQMRQNCRRHVEENFTVEKMTDGYEEVYTKILTRKNVF